MIHSYDSYTHKLTKDISLQHSFIALMVKLFCFNIQLLTMTTMSFKFLLMSLISTVEDCLLQIHFTVLKYLLGDFLTIAHVHAHAANAK